MCPEAACQLETTGVTTGLLHCLAMFVHMFRPGLRRHSRRRTGIRDLRSSLPAAPRACCTTPPATGRGDGQRYAFFFKLDSPGGFDAVKSDTPRWLRSQRLQFTGVAQVHVRCKFCFGSCCRVAWPAKEQVCFVAIVDLVDCEFRNGGSQARPAS